VPRKDMVYARKRKSTPYARWTKKARRIIPVRMSRAVGGASAKMNKTTLYGNWNFSTGTTSGFWRYLEFTAATLPEWNDYALVFDEYKVTNLKYTFRPAFNSYPITNGFSGVASTFGVPYMHLIVDPASTKLPTGAYNAVTELSMLDQGMAKTYTADKPFSISFKPRVQGSLGGGGTAATSLVAPWIRTSEETTIHTGLHAFIKNREFTSNYCNFDVYVTVSIEFRGSR